jgi:hypothetical protein
MLQRDFSWVFGQLSLLAFGLELCADTVLAKEFLVVGQVFA